MRWGGPHRIARNRQARTAAASAPKSVASPWPPPVWEPAVPEATDVMGEPGGSGALGLGEIGSAETFTEPWNEVSGRAGARELRAGWIAPPRGCPEAIPVDCSAGVVVEISRYGLVSGIAAARPVRSGPRDTPPALTPGGTEAGEGSAPVIGLLGLAGLSGAAVVCLVGVAEANALELLDAPARSIRVVPTIVEVGGANVFEIPVEPSTGVAA
jgi:hypothetical protein